MKAGRRRGCWTQEKCRFAVAQTAQHSKVHLRRSDVAAERGFEWRIWRVGWCSDIMDIQVSVVIPCRNERRQIEKCLASAVSQSFPDGALEVIIADGMSDDGTRRVIEEFGRQTSNGERQDASRGRPKPIVRLIDNPARIVSSGLNAGIRAARGEIIVRMDAHTEYATDYVQTCVQVLEEKRADNVGGPARTKAESYIERAIVAAYHSPFSVGGARFHNVRYEGPVDTVTYGCWRKDVFDKYGYFDEELVRNQDDEHNLRIVRGGGTIWQSPRIKSWYRPRGALKSLFQQYMQYGYWKVRVIQKHKLPASPRHLVPGAFVGAGLLLALMFLGAAGLGRLMPSSWAAASHFCELIAEGSGWGFAALTGLYLAAVFGASLVTGLRSHWRLLPILPAVFGCYHIGYGWGFLRGVWDFLATRRGPRQELARLSR